MKQGSADDPFAEEPEPGTDEAGDEPEPDTDETVDDPAERSPEESAATGPETTGREDPSSTRVGEPSSDAGGSTVQSGSLPYIHARDGVKDGRTQRPVFLRDHVEDGIDDLLDRMEAELGEDVYKTDVTEAAMAVAQENPELVLAKLQEWGYGWT